MDAVTEIRESAVPFRRRVKRWLTGLALLAAVGVVAVLLGRPLWAEYHLRAARRCIARQQFTEAQHHLHQCLTIWPNKPSIHFLAARTARRVGDWDEARQHLAEFERFGGNAPALNLELSLLLAQQGDLDAAREQSLWLLVEQHHADSPLILEALAKGYLYSYRVGEALDCLKRLLDQEPDNTAALLLRGTAFQGLGRHTEALAAYRHAVDLDAECDEARLRLADLLAADPSQTDEAVEQYELLRRRQPKNRSVLLGSARVYLITHRGAEARQLLESLLADHPDDPAALLERGKLALREDDAAAGEVWLRQALTRDPFEQEAMFQLILSLQQQKKTEEVATWRIRLKAIEVDLERLRELSQQVSQRPNEAALRYEAGTICMRNGQEQEGLRWLYGALQNDPQHVPTQAALAAYFKQRDTTKSK